jgi:hypothetical protein
VLGNHSTKLCYFFLKVQLCLAAVLCVHYMASYCLTCTVFYLNSVLISAILSYHMSYHIIPGRPAGKVSVCRVIETAFISG